MKTLLSLPKKLLLSCVGLVLLIGSLCGMTFLSNSSQLDYEDTLLGSGNVKINLNDGKAVITAEEACVAPGMEIVRTFTLTNEGTAKAFFRIYMDEVGGSMAQTVSVSVVDGTQTLFCATPETFTKSYVKNAQGILEINETKTLKLVFRFPPHTANEGQEMYLRFTLCADAVQVQNNTEREFS